MHHDIVMVHEGRNVGLALLILITTLAFVMGDARSLAPSRSSRESPVRVIFDTDIVGDADE